MTINFEFYHVFYLVAKTKNITRAAEELCISQSSVSRSIQNLESYLNCSLFARNRQGVKITPEGEALFQQIEPACKAIFDAEGMINRVKSLTMGIIRISANDIGVKFLSSYMIEFKNKYPNVIFQISRLAPNEIYTALHYGNIDLALDFDINLYEGLKNIPQEIYNEKKIQNETIDIERKVLGKFKDVAIVGDRYKELCNKSYTIKDLIKFPLILPQMDDVSKDFYMSLYLKAGRVYPAELELSGASLRIQFTVQNFGISFIPTECIQAELMEKKLYILDIKEKLLQRQLVMMTSKNRQMNIASKRFVEMLKIKLD